MRLELARTFTPWGTLRLASQDNRCNLEEETLILGGIIQLYYVRFGIFLGSLGIFVRLIRGELAERTLHYSFLAPVRRELLIIGKFLAGVLTTATVFGAGILTSLVLMYAHFEAGRAFVLSGPGPGHLRAYLLVATLACLGYGAVFLAMSLLFKNPIVPAVVLLFWEGINGVLPVWLKRLSVTYYLKPLFPVDLPITGFLGLFTVVAEPTPSWLAVSGLLVFTALVLAFACWRIRRLEVLYSTD
jgi:ABC-type transport system involved in multi-copper enzyme maturation permease subunit